MGIKHEHLRRQRGRRRERWGQTDGHDVSIMYECGLEVLTAVAMKSSIFWYITQCSPLKNKVEFQRTTRR
jgi:hypothetical protein